MSTGSETVKRGEIVDVLLGESNLCHHKSQGVHATVKLSDFGDS